MGAYNKESHSSVQPTHSPPDSTTYIPHGEGNAETSDQHRLNHQTRGPFSLELNKMKVIFDVAIDTLKHLILSNAPTKLFFSGCKSDAEERDRSPSNHETIRASALVTQSPPSTDTLTYNFET